MLARRCFNLLYSNSRRISLVADSTAVKLTRNGNKLDVIDNKNLLQVNEFELPLKRHSVLDECKEDLNLVEPDPSNRRNFASNINHSKPLQELLSLGVNLHNVEKKLKHSAFILQENFVSHLKKLVEFFANIEVLPNQVGGIISKNPQILKDNLEDLEVRVNYLRSKLFSDNMIHRIVTRNPNWLSFDTRAIDNRLGFFQKQYSLSGLEVRTLATKQPKLITFKLGHIKKNFFVLKEEMGFMDFEVKSILIKQPNIFMKDSDKMLAVFDFIHNEMKIPLERIANNPQALTCRLFKIKQRHLFLESLGKAQYSFREPNYISLMSLIEGTDVEFCENIAKSSVQSFNIFLKSL